MLIFQKIRTVSETTSSGSNVISALVVLMTLFFSQLDDDGKYILFMSTFIFLTGVSFLHFFRSLGLSKVNGFKQITKIYDYTGIQNFGATQQRRKHE